MVARHFTWGLFSRYYSYFLHKGIWVLFSRWGYFREEDKSAKNAKITPTRKFPRLQYSKDHISNCAVSLKCQFNSVLGIIQGTLWQHCTASVVYWSWGTVHISLWWSFGDPIFNRTVKWCMTFFYSWFVTTYSLRVLLKYYQIHSFLPFVLDIELLCYCIPTLANFTTIDVNNK